VTLDTPSRPNSNTEILIWQSRIRITVASIASIAALVLLAGHAATAGVAPGALLVLLSTSGYMLIAASMAAIARRATVLPGWVVGATVAADIGFIFGLTVAISAPAYYHRILIFAFFALHLNTFYFGRSHAAGVLALTVVGYLTLISASISRGAPLHWEEEIWSVGAFVLAAVVLVAEHGRLRSRLASIEDLFGRAEEGDFSEAYDDDADARPDSITQVGRAYNRVRGQLASMVLSDPLTGCVNRRGFDQALAREVARCSRAGSELALLALDIDYFKAVNDTMGHLAGDAVLREVGALLLHTARAGDVVARTGGEEFALILPDTSASGAYQLASRLRDVIRAHRFANGARGTRLTVSIGVVSTDAPLGGRTVEIAEVLKGRADEALYAAKRGGRDRVRAWTASDDQIVLRALL
jgi:diguanylate cyclase (GGDEF)-like protein